MAFEHLVDLLLLASPFILIAVLVLTARVNRRIAREGKASVAWLRLYRWRWIAGVLFTIASWFSHFSFVSDRAYYIRGFPLSWWALDDRGNDYVTSLWPVLAFGNAIVWFFWPGVILCVWALMRPRGSHPLGALRPFVARLSLLLGAAGLCALVWLLAAPMSQAVRDRSGHTALRPREDVEDRPPATRAGRAERARFGKKPDKFSGDPESETHEPVGAAPSGGTTGADDDHGGSVASELGKLRGRVLRGRARSLQEVLDVCRGILLDETSSLQAAALDRLAELGQDAASALPVIVATLSTRPDLASRALSAIREMGPAGRSALEAVRGQEPGPEDEGLVRAGIEWRVARDRNAAIRTLRQPLETGAVHHRTRIELMCALTDLGPAAEPLAAALLSRVRRGIDEVGDEDVAWALVSLAALGHRPARALAETYVASSDLTKRAAAARVLAKVDGRLDEALRVYVAAIAGLRDLRGNHIGLFCVDWIGEMGLDAASAGPVLEETMATGSWAFRCRAADALYLIGGDVEKAVPVLSESLRQRRWSTFQGRWAADPFDPARTAARRLARMGPPAGAALPELRRVMATAEDYSLRRLARIAIERISDD